MNGVPRPVHYAWTPAGMQPATPASPMRYVKEHDFHAVVRIVSMRSAALEVYRDALIDVKRIAAMLEDRLATMRLGHDE